ncbi:MAG TPA: ABC transporter ATP-binding protein [Candidatus Manganitrophaceae bacterium]|nr:ABC transporter ATP-binding protein [Candidatus Manganitrophaceae bacterium]
MLIQFREVSKIYPMGEVAIPALERVSFTIEKGEFVSIVGPSGSGKTTILDILGCLSRPTSGAYLLNDEAVQGLSDPDLAKIRNEKIGFIFQTFHLLPRNSALENVALPLFYAGLPKEGRTERAKEALAKVGLSDRTRHRPNQLSGGQQQRVAIARALVNNPDIILADEPTGNLDSKSGREITDLLLKLHQNGHTLILVTHDRELAAGAKRTLILKDGRIVGNP